MLATLVSDAVEFPSVSFRTTAKASENKTFVVHVTDVKRGVFTLNECLYGLVPVRLRCLGAEELLTCNLRLISQFVDLKTPFPTTVVIQSSLHVFLFSLCEKPMKRMLDREFK